MIKRCNIPKVIDVFEIGEKVHIWKNGNLIFEGLFEKNNPYSKEEIVGAGWDDEIDSTELNEYHSAILEDDDCNVRDDVKYINKIEYIVQCDICGKKEFVYLDRKERSDYIIRKAGMKKIKDKRILCPNCYKKNKIVGKLVVCNNRNKKWCPHGESDVICEFHDPHKKKFGQPIEFVCTIGDGWSYKRMKCHLKTIKEMN